MGSDNAQLSLSRATKPGISRAQQRRVFSSKRLAWPLLIAGSTLAFSAQADVSFSKVFSPVTIGPGATSTLTFTIDNTPGDVSVGVRGLAFTDTLPDDMVMADPANASTNCSSANLSAPAGGDTIDFSEGALPLGSSCTVSVDVTKPTPGTSTNTSGNLTWDGGSTGSATATLTVDAGRPGFSKSFSPSAVFFGGRSTLTFTIDNSANTADALNLTFTDSLPAGMQIASPTNAVNTCGGQLAAPAGGGVISLSPFGGPTSLLPVGATCTVSVDVIANAIGTLGNTSGELTSQVGAQFLSSGKASASLTATVEQISLIKSFTDDPVPPGGTVTLEFTLQNLDRSFPATNIGFTDDLDATLSGLVAIGLGVPLRDVCGLGSSLFGTNVITLTGGSLEAGESCTLSISLQVPTDAAAGQFGNTTSEITADIDGATVTGDPASDLLFVAPAPLLVKTFLDNPVGAGDTTRLEFTITNTSLAASVSNIEFEDVFDVILPTAVGVPNQPCGPGSLAQFSPLSNPPPPSSVVPARLSVSGGNLNLGQSCTFILELNVATGAATGTYFNTTGPISGDVAGVTYTGSPASDSLDVIAAPTLSKSFTDDPAVPGGTVTLEFTLSHDATAPGVATDIAFTDDLAAVLSGLEAVGLPQTDVCGPGSEIAGTGNLAFSGGFLVPGESCTFSVTLQVPADPAPAPGNYTNTTSNVQATVLDLLTTENPASDDLQIAGLVLSKEFTDDPVLPGDTVNLRFTLDNLSPVSAASAISFTDDLDAALSGLTAVGLPLVDPCGGGSTIAGSSGNTFLTFNGGSLAALAGCSFDVSLQVPAGAATDSYVNTTSAVSASVDGATLAFDPATDQLEVVADLLTLSKEFIDDPANPGGTTTLRFTLGNLSPTDTLSNIAFTDDLEAALPGLAATGLPVSACGGTFDLDGSGLPTFSGGSLAPEESCFFDVLLSVPENVPLGTVYTNTTSEASANVGDLGITAPPASDVLAINFLAFSKAFSGAATQGGSVDLTFTIANLSPTETASGLEFNDNLDFLSGLVAIGLPQADLCGVGSLVSGDVLISLSNGSVAPNGSCTITVTLDVPPDAAPGEYLNTTSTLRQEGIPVAGSATASLLVEIPNGDGDDDGDGVANVDDFCPDTLIPESVPLRFLRPGAFALATDDGIFDTTESRRGPFVDSQFTIDMTAGCSCEQILAEAANVTNPVQTRFGCFERTMQLWINLMNQL